MQRRRSRIAIILGALALIAVIVGLVLYLTQRPTLRAPQILGPLLQDAVYINVDDDIQAVVDEHDPGTLFVIKSGVHRLQHIVPRDGDMFVGEPGAVLNGSRLLTDFVREGRFWVADGQDQEPWNAGICRQGFEACNIAHDLFIDDVPLRPVASLDELAPGTWYFDYDADRVYFMDDPTGHTVEVSVPVNAFDGNATNVLIQGLTIKKYAGPGQMGAIRGIDSTNWTVERNTVELNGAVGITAGDGMRILNNFVTHNGQLGISGSASNVVLEGNEISYNNFDQYDSGWEAGGVKFVGTVDLVARDNYVHHNDGPGLWTDGGSQDILYENNIVISNADAGIFHEISYDAVIRDNIVKMNSARPPGWLFGAQILLSSSSKVEVYGNEAVVSEKGGNGIAIIQQNRGEGAYGVYFATDNWIHHNTVVFMGVIGQSGAATDWDHARFWQETDNRFSDNHYFVADMANTYWGWTDAARNWESIQAEGQEQGSTLSGEIALSALFVPPWSARYSIMDTYNAS